MTKKIEDPQFVSGLRKVSLRFEELKYFKLLARIPMVTSVIKDFFGNQVMLVKKPTIGIYELAK